MRGLILSGGKGTRLRPLTHTSAKQLVPVANKPVLFYGIEAMAAAGIEEIGIIIAPETGDEIRAADRRRRRLRRVDRVHRAGRAERPGARRAHRGEVHRRLAVRDVPRRQPAARRDRRPGRDVPQRPARRADPADAGVRPGALRRRRARGRAGVARLVEKPKEPKTDLALVGVYMFNTSIFDAARAIEPSWRGELEITDAIQALVDRGLRVDPHIVHGWWKDTGQVQDMLEANRLILDDIEESLGRRARGHARRGPRLHRRGRAARARDRARPGDRRPRQPHHERLHRPVHGDRRGRDDRRRRARALDRACRAPRSPTWTTASRRA